MSNRKVHRRESSFRRFEKFVQHRLRYPNRNSRYARQLEMRHERRNVCKLLGQWLMEVAEVPVRYSVGLVDDDGAEAAA